MDQSNKKLKLLPRDSFLTKILQYVVFVILSSSYCFVWAAKVLNWMHSYTPNLLRNWEMLICATNHHESHLRQCRRLIFIIKPSRFVHIVQYGEYRPQEITIIVLLKDECDHICTYTICNDESTFSFHDNITWFLKMKWFLNDNGTSFVRKYKMHEHINTRVMNSINIEDKISHYRLIANNKSRYIYIYIYISW